MLQRWPLLGVLMIDRLMSKLVVLVWGL